MDNDDVIMELQLTNMGFSLEFTTLDPGGYDVDSEFSVTVSRGDERLTVPFSKNFVHRRWVKHRPRGTRLLGWDYGTKYWEGKYESSAPVAYFERKLERGNPRDEAVIAEFDDWTEPLPPTLAEVLYGLLADAQSDSHTRAVLVLLGVDFGKLEKLFEDY